MNSRKGIFHIPTEYINTNTRLVKLIMSKCIIVRCEHDYMRDRFTYHAICNLFNKLEEGCVSPTYTFEITGYEGISAVLQDAPYNYNFI